MQAAGISIAQDSLGIPRAQSRWEAWNITRWTQEHRSLSSRPPPSEVCCLHRDRQVTLLRLALSPCNHVTVPLVTRDASMIPPIAGRYCFVFWRPKDSPLRGIVSSPEDYTWFRKMAFNHPGVTHSFNPTACSPPSNVIHTYRHISQPNVVRGCPSYLQGYFGLATFGIPSQSLLPQGVAAYREVLAARVNRLGQPEPNHIVRTCPSPC